MQKSNIKKSVLALAIAQCFSSNADAATIMLNGGCSLRDAIQSANTDASVNGCATGNGDDTISMLASSIVTLSAIDPAGDMVAGLPTITSNLTIQGNGSTITRDEQAPGFRIFTVGNNATFELNNVTITNGVGTGAAIEASNAELIKISNSTISNHSAGMVNGSPSNSNIGLNIADTDLELIESTVTNNSGTNNVGIFVESGNVTITESLVTHNNASSSSAGLYVAYGSLTMSQADISHNIASFGSGASLYNASSVSITQSQINENTGSSSGLYVYQAESAGALTLTILNSHVNQNEGDYSGLYLYAGSLTETSTATINNVTISKNISASSAGVDLIGDLLNVFATDLVVSQNRGGDDEFSGVSISGGAMVNLENLELINNTPQTGATANRSGLTVKESTLTLNNSNISNNSAQRISSAIYMTSYSNVQVTNTKIINNSMVDGHSGIHAPVHVDNSILTLTNVTLDGNISTKDGGAIHADNGSSLTINGSTISDNFSPNAYGGGALYLGYGTITSISNSTLSGNRAGDGSAIKSVDSNTLIINNVTVANHDSATPGNSSFTLSISGIQSQLAINNSLFSGNNGDLCNMLLPGGVGTDNWFEDASCNGLGQGLLQLGTLTNNGGLTATHALPFGSPAIDTGSSAICSASPVNALDQRGERRGSLCDIGAYEFVDKTIFFVIRSADGKIITVAL